MQAIWNGHASDMWDEAHARLSGPLQQDWMYGLSLQALGVGCLRARVVRDGQTLALAQFILRRVAGFVTVVLCSRGPLWVAPLSEPEKAQVFSLLKRSIPLPKPRFVLFTPNEPWGAALGTDGMTRVMTGYSTVEWDITPAMEVLRAQLEKRWRHRLKGAEESGLTAHRMGANVAQFGWLIEADMNQREQRGLLGLPPAFFELYSKARLNPVRSVLGMRADMGKQRVAGMLFLIHGTAATYQVGWNGDTGRDLHAHNLLLWRAVEELKQRGVKRLDLGGANTERSAGIARFKISTGGAVLTLAGTYW